MARDLLGTPASQGSALKLHGTLVLLAPLLPPTSGHFLLSCPSYTVSHFLWSCMEPLFGFVCLFLIKLIENVFILYFFYSFY